MNVSICNLPNFENLNQNLYRSLNKSTGQSTIFDPFGNLQTTGVNSNTQHLMSANGIRDAANSGSNAHLQNPFGSLNNAANTNSLAFNENGT